MNTLSCMVCKVSNAHERFVKFQMHKLSYGRKFKFGISESPHILNSTGQSERGALMKAMKKKRDNVLCILKVIAKEISYF